MKRKNLWTTRLSWRLLPEDLVDVWASNVGMNSLLCEFAYARKCQLPVAVMTTIVLAKTLPENPYVVRRRPRSGIHPCFQFQFEVACLVAAFTPYAVARYR